MRLLLIAILTVSLGGGATFAQTSTRTSPSLSPLRLHDSAVVDCVQMWDSGTHMTMKNGRAHASASRDALMTGC